MQQPAGQSSSDRASAKLHEDLWRDDEVSGSSDRTFGLLIAAVCGVIGGVRLGLGHAHAGWWLGIALAVLLLALFWTPPLALLNRLWFRFGLLLYKVVNPLVMAAIFYSTMVPIGLFLRLRGKDPLRLRREPDVPTYWLPHDPPGPPPETMRNQF
jgi:saxitoxin biosynthesis operon SxtJ-like protein